LFDLSDYETWREVEDCLTASQQHAPYQCVKLLVGCKNDLPIDPLFGEYLLEVYAFIDK
jgi:hypothetical protein